MEVFQPKYVVILFPKKLRDFGIDFRTDIGPITTDGCSMMKKLRRLIPSLQQLCYTHGLQLVIQDIFYQKQSSSMQEIICTYSSEYDECEVSTIFNHVDFSQLFDRLLQVRFG